MKLKNASVDHRYSVDDIASTPWSDIERIFAETEIYALTTLLPDGMPHTVPVSGLLGERGFFFTSGPKEQKVQNLIADPRASVHVGSAHFFEGVDIVLRGPVERVTDAETLTWMRDAFIAKYCEFWTFGIGEEVFINHHGWPSWCFLLRPTAGYSFTRSESTAQTKYEFDN